MGVLVTKREYINQYRPYDANINWLIGNTGTWQQLKITVEVETRIDFTTSNTLFMEEPNVFTLTDGSTWEENGFTIGDSFEMGWSTTDVSTGSTTTDTVTGQIVRFDGNTMYSNNSTLGLGAAISNIYPVQLGDTKIHSVYIVTDKQPQGIDFQYGHIKNSTSTSNNLKSFIDATDTLFTIDDVDTMTFGQVRAMATKGLRSGMSIARCSLEYVTKIDFKYYYTVDVVYMLSTFFDDTTIATNGTPSEVLGSECITDNFRLRAYTTYNNPNVFLENDIATTAQLGNTGYFDENYNGLNNEFTVSSLTYENANGVVASQLDYANPITVRAVIDNIANITPFTMCSFGFIWLPTDSTYYKQTNNPFYENLKVSTGGGIQSTFDVFNVTPVFDTSLRQGYSTDGASMDVTNMRFNATSPTQITFEADFTPNAAFTTFFNSLDEQDRNYKLWVNVADQNDPTNKSNRVSLELDFNTLDTYIEPIGEFEDMTIGFLTHPQDETGTPSLCGNSIIVEDDLLARIEFLVDSTVSPTVPVPNGLEYGVLIQRDSDGFQYKLDSYSIDLSIYPDPTQYNFSALRGFKLEVGNNKNLVEAKYYPAIDTGSKLGVLGLYGFKVRWEDWLSRPNVPQEVRNTYFDNTKEQDGLNNDWYNYLTGSGWSLLFYVFTDATLNGEQVRYENTTPLSFVDYNDNADISVSFTYKRASDGTVLTGGVDPISGLPLGVILDNEDTLLEIEYTRSVGTWTDLLTTYGVSSIEVDGGAGQFEYRQLSSIWGSETDNPLVPIAGTTLLDLVIVSPTVVRASCLIEPSKLIQSNRYKITGRIGCK